MSEICRMKFVLTESHLPGKIVFAIIVSKKHILLAFVDWTQPAMSVKNCKLKHHKLMHRKPAKPVSNEPQTTKASSLTPSSPTPSSVYFSKNSSCRVFLNVVLVKVLCNGREVHTYAFLDQGSTTTLCDEKLLHQLDIVGKDVSFTITTVNEKTETPKGMKTKLFIAGLDDRDLVELSEVLSVEHLPIKANSSLTKEDLKCWPHLKGMLIPCLKSSVSLLISIDNPELFRTMEERRGEKGQPFAVTTILGWSLVGAETSCANETPQVNFIAQQSQIIEKEVSRLWKLDLLPQESGNEKGLLKEDRLVLRKMEDSKQFTDGHYQLALPWKPGAPTLNDNRSLAEARQQNLR